jgi:hypothetical protein
VDDLEAAQNLLFRNICFLVLIKVSIYVASGQGYEET